MSEQARRPGEFTDEEFERLRSMPMKNEDGTLTEKGAWIKGGTEIERFNQTVSRIIAATPQGEVCDLSDVVFPSDFAYSSVIQSDISLKGAAFEGRAIFKSVAFAGNANFQNVRFKNFADFTNSEFLGSAKFAGARFKQYASFEGGQFRRGAYFDSTRFSGAIAFDQRVFSSNTIFRDAVFKNLARFQNCQFDGVTRFNEAHFREPPDFHNAQLYADTSFDGAFFKPLKGNSEAARFRVLKVAMNERQNRADEGRFFALEQTAMLTSFWPTLWPSWAYRATSNYGQRFGQPIFEIVALLLIFTVAYRYLAPCVECPQQVVWCNSFQFGIEQIVRPFGVWAPRPGQVSQQLFAENFGLGIKLLASLQSLLSTSLLALSLLALRWRFRRG